MLKDSGRRVTVIEKRRFLENNSARNTGKVSALHGALYHTLPADIAQSVYQLNRTAVDHYEQLIRTADIACRWQRTSAILAAQSEEGAAILNQEDVYKRQVKLTVRYNSTASASETIFPYRGLNRIRSIQELNQRTPLNSPSSIVA